MGESFEFSLSVIYGMAELPMKSGDRVIIYGDDRFEENDTSLAALAWIDGSKIIDNGHARSTIGSFPARF